MVNASDVAVPVLPAAECVIEIRREANGTSVNHPPQISKTVQPKTRKDKMLLLIIGIPIMVLTVAYEIISFYYRFQAIPNCERYGMASFIIIFM